MKSSYWLFVNIYINISKSLTLTFYAYIFLYLSCFVNPSIYSLIIEFFVIEIICGFFFKIFSVKGF